MRGALIRTLACVLLADPLSRPPPHLPHRLMATGADAAAAHADVVAAPAGCACACERYSVFVSVVGMGVGTCLCVRTYVHT